MMVHVLHAIAALLALLLFVVRRQKVTASVCRSTSIGIKKRELEQNSKVMVPPRGKVMTTSPPPVSAMYIARAPRPPRCKRDPDISVDNEAIGQGPFD